MIEAVVITTIASPTPAVEQIEELAKPAGIPLIIVSDTKTPEPFGSPYADVLSVSRQKECFPEFSDLLPWKHYARKNLGYLYAVQQGATSILETDDDNFPEDGFLLLGEEIKQAEFASHEKSWVNVYSLFGGGSSWPRGYPLEHIHNDPVVVENQTYSGPFYVVQGLANDNPDVDAVFRLTQDLPLRFEPRNPVAISAGNWCPFNSQNTRFQMEVLPLMYLPSYCSFRMTDIWRSFVAQRCLWAMNACVTFVSPTVSQDRNEHNLMVDFKDEIPGYLNNAAFCDVLANLHLPSEHPADNLLSCYTALSGAGYFPAEELELVELWILECNRLG